MSGLVNALVIVVVAALVIARQFRARRFDTGRRWWLLPAVLAVVALRDPGMVDVRHRTESVALLAAEVAVGLAIGAGWAWTTRIWVEADGTVWTRSGRAGAAVWIAGIAVRGGLFGLGVLLGVRQNSSAVTLALAGTLLVRSAVLASRTRALATAEVRVPSDLRATADVPAAAYRDAMPRPAWKERV
ncbi:DUF1453 domain-containing protein [Streptomyces sp. NPDC086766]|uniref:DUF1453 domain-containing protein n=1 Tax=Streptomyces sp. NPDC086766 TaxID=3365754 RepID=UPI0037F4CDF4